PATPRPAARGGVRTPAPPLRPAGKPNGTARRDTRGAAGSTSLHRGRGPAPGGETGRRPSVASASPAGLTPLDARVRALIERERHYCDSAGALVSLFVQVSGSRLAGWKPSNPKVAGSDCAAVAGRQPASAGRGGAAGRDLR